MSAPLPAGPVLTVNAGSSSVKLSVVGEGSSVLSRTELPAPGLGGEDHLASFLAGAPPLGAVAHRVVHGGRRFLGPVVIGPEVEADLGALADLAPLHNGPALRLVDEVRDALPGLPAVACFDTAFFAHLPAEAATYALPEDWRGRLGIRRYGFHGLSHAWTARRAAEVVGRPLAALRLVSAHLGSGASLAAVAGGRPVDTTMGFTPLEGLVMSTRSGSVDPGALTYLLRHGGVEADELDWALERRSGLLALAGTGDLRQVVAGAGRGDAGCQLAWATYLHRLRAGVGAMAAAAGGLDVLAFTGGAGQASPLLRQEACGGLGFLGIHLDGERNGAGPPDRLVSSDASPVAVVVVEAREDLEMARLARRLLGW